MVGGMVGDVVIEKFDIVNLEKSGEGFDIYVDEKKVEVKEDKRKGDMIWYGFGE